MKNIWKWCLEHEVLEGQKQRSIKSIPVVQACGCPSSAQKWMCVCSFHWPNTQKRKNKKQLYSLSLKSMDIMDDGMRVNPQNAIFS